MKVQNKIATRAKRFFADGTFEDTAVLYGNRRAVVQGCRKIISYSPDEIRLALRKQTMRILGKDLACVSFSAGGVTVEGQIFSVQLQPKSKGEET